jgi:hypothetical protein
MLVFHVKEENFVVWKDIMMGGAERRIVYVFIYNGPTFIAAADITLGL